MLAFFRRILSSGVAVVILGVILLAFVFTGIGSPGARLFGGGDAAPDAVATVGGRPVTIAEVQNRAQQELRVAARQQPGVTMPQFLAAIGGVPALVDQVIGGAVLTRWAEKHGLVAGKRLVDGEISSIPAFQGPAGTFDQTQMNAILGQQRMSFAQLRDGVRDDLLRRQVLLPLSTGTRAPNALLNPYAMLLLDKRQGAIGMVPASTEGLAAPTDAEITAFYQGHVAAYSLPDRRVVRYAPIGPDTIAVPPPTDAEIAASYTANAASYAASETRTVSQVVLPDANAAKGFVAKVAGGTPFAKAAADAGFAAGDISLGALTRAALAKSASPAVAAAIFAAPNGGTTQPLKTELGYAIAHVDAVTARPARSLDQARAEIAAALARKKAAETIGTLVNQVQDALNDGANFADTAKRFKLGVVGTPPLLADGTAPSDPAFKPDATLAALMRVVKTMTPDDRPSLETVGADGRYALVAVAGMVRAAPIPLAQIGPRVRADLIADRAATRARTTAQGLLARLDKGVPIATAFAELKLPPPQPIVTTQVQVAQAGERVPPPVRELFRLVPGRNALLPGPNGAWFVVRLDRILPGETAMLPAIAAATRTELGQSLGDEYAQQFANAARAEVKVTHNAAAVAELTRQLRGAAGAER